MNATVVADTKRVNLVDLARRYVKLKRQSSIEWAGPCPACGGENRFRVQAGLWFCRQCHPKPGDAIDLIRLAEQCSFADAVERLSGDKIMSTLPVGPVPARPVVEPPAWDQEEVESELLVMQSVLSRSPGAEYLASRGLTEKTWGAFGLGYDHRRHAIAMPWYRGGLLTGIRFRLITPRPNMPKVIMREGSRIRSLMFGGQAFHLFSPTFISQRYLLIVEGEINAMSAFQVMNPANMDVLSLGSESSPIPESFIPTAMPYRTRLVWMDKEEKAREQAARIFGAAIWSDGPDGKRDANDHLKAGTLFDLLAFALRTETPPEYAEGLKWDLWDALNFPRPMEV